jgi:glyoxylase-like metal-dependent hydrolase (beta-lactamase superfamily II)
MTHLHFDHTGGMKALSHATFHVCREEWEHATSMRPFDAMRQGYVAGDYRALSAKMDLMDLPQYFDRHDDGHDIFGDGSVEAFALPGHTVGHTGYRINLSNGQRIIHTGDAIYNTRMLSDVEPGPMANLACSNKNDLTFTMQELRRYHQLYPEDLMVCGHDFELGERCMNGPVALHG